MCVRHYRIRESPTAVILHHPDLAHGLGWPAYQHLWEEALHELTERFGYSLRRKLLVCVFPCVSELCQLFETEMQAGALTHGDAVVVGADQPRDCGEIGELARHELTHLFASYWGEYEPSFKGEGLAVFMEGTRSSKCPDVLALASLLGGPWSPLSWLLEEDRFHADRHKNYAIAGSFTSYLVRRFSWEKYAAFYRQAGPENFEQAVQNCFELSLHQVERDWREDLLLRREELTPALERELAEERVTAAYNSWQLYRCLEEAEPYLQSPEEQPRIVWTAAAAHALLGNYSQAIALYEELLHSAAPSSECHRGSVWLELGRLYDVTGQREKAVEAYNYCLNEPERWRRDSGSTHDQAKGHLQCAYTEAEFLLRLDRQVTGRR